MTTRYKSDAMAAIHETMESLHERGAIDKKTMRQFDASCLTPICSLTPEKWDQFNKMLSQPPSVNKKLKKLLMTKPPWE